MRNFLGQAILVTTAILGGVAGAMIGYGFGGMVGAIIGGGVGVAVATGSLF